MKRLLTIVCALLGFAPAAAHAAAPPMTVAGALGTVTLPSAGGCTMGPSGGVCADPAAPQDGAPMPELAVLPGDQLTVTVAPTSLDAQASLMNPSWVLGLAAVAPLTYRTTLPATLGPVAYLLLSGHWQDGPQHGDAVYFARLRTALTATVAPATRLTGSRLRWTVTCPPQAGLSCAGTATLQARANWQRLARESFTRLAPGTSRTFTSTVKPGALRRLRAHRSTAARAVVDPALMNQPAAKTLLRVRRERVAAAPLARG